MWDLPIDSVAQAPTIEQMQQLEKAKTAKVKIDTVLFLYYDQYDLSSKCVI